MQRISIAIGADFRLISSCSGIAYKIRKIRCDEIGKIGKPPFSIPPFAISEITYCFTDYVYRGFDIVIGDIVHFNSPLG